MLMVREIFMERQFAFPSILLCIPLNPALHSPQSCFAFPSILLCIPLNPALHSPQSCFAFPSTPLAVPLTPKAGVQKVRWVSDGKGVNKREMGNCWD